MRHPACAIEEFTDLVDDFCEFRFVLQKLIGNAVNGKRIRVDLAILRADIKMQRAASGKMIDQFDTADFNHAVQLRFEARGFRIENDLAFISPRRDSSA